MVIPASKLKLWLWNNLIVISIAVPVFTWDSKKYLKEEMNKTGHSLVAISLTACNWFLSTSVGSSSQANLTESAKVTSSCLAHTPHCALKIYFKSIWKGIENMQLIPCGSMHTGNHICVWELS